KGFFTSRNFDKSRSFPNKTPQASQSFAIRRWRNKLKINFIRRLCRPDWTSVSGFTAYGCRVLLAGKNTAHLARMSFSRGA
ncbi:MAG: hypothetical protein SOV41_03190, partial [Oscillospiraceae bacterium]|nr:hypothetical protein [Oscillospiraceae bacterium]